MTIYHNPACGTSRNTLALIRACNIEPEVIEYLKNPPDRETLRSLISAAGMRVRDALRRKGTPFEALGLDAPDLTDEQLLQHVQEHPILLNRPFVVSARGVKLCRPSDLVLDLLPPIREVLLLKEDQTAFVADRPIPASDPGLRAALAAEGLPIDDLADPGRQFFSCRTLDGALVGYGGFERYGEHALIRSLVVLPEVRGKGLGSTIVALLLRRAFDSGARHAWALTTSASPFFRSAGFSVVARDQAPAEITSTRQASQPCPASATLLTRRIEL